MITTGEYGNLAADKGEREKRLAIEDAPAKVRISRDQAKRIASNMKAEAEERQRMKRRNGCNRVETLRRRKVKEEEDGAKVIACIEI